MSNISPKVYSKIIDLQEVTQFESELMSSGYSKMTIDIDFFSDANASIEAAATGSVTFIAQTTTSPTSEATINSSTVDVENRDYDRPFASGRVVRVNADLSSITGARYVRVEIWRA